MDIAIAIIGVLIMSSLLPVIAALLLEGMKAWNEERRTRFMAEHHELMTKIEVLKSRTGKDWIDSDLAVAKRDLELFIKAYAKEVGYAV